MRWPPCDEAASMIYVAGFRVDGTTPKKVLFVDRSETHVKDKRQSGTRLDGSGGVGCWYIYIYYINIHNPTGPLSQSRRCSVQFSLCLRYDQQAEDLFLSAD